MYRFILLLISVSVIVGIIFIAKITGNEIEFCSTDFFLNLITEIIGITVSVILIEIFGTKILRYIESKKNKSINLYLDKRLDSIIHRLKQKLSYLNIDTGKKYTNSTDLVNSIDINYLNTNENRAFISNGQITTKSFVRPILFSNEYQSILSEIQVLSNQLPPGLPVEIYEGLLMLQSHDNYMWNNAWAPVSKYNQAWLDTFKDILLDKYQATCILIKGKEKLEKIIK